MSRQYDIIIVGAGAAGVFAAYELAKSHTRASVLMLERGRPLEERVCPIKSGRVRSCIKCDPCHIMNGYGGARFPTANITSRRNSAATCTAMSAWNMQWS